MFVVLMTAWFLGWIVFPIAGGLIHVLLAMGVIALILHFKRERSRAAI